MKGATVRVAVRHSEWAFIDAARDEGPIVLMAADVRNEGAIAAAILGADSVVNAAQAQIAASDRGQCLVTWLALRGVAEVRNEGPSSTAWAPAPCGVKQTSEWATQRGRGPN
jgi:hypothetical protein